MTAIEIGKEYRLLPNARRGGFAMGRGALTIFNDDVTRVRVLSGPDSDGDYYVISLNGTDNDANHKVGVGYYAYILPEFLAPLEEEEKVEVGVEIDVEIGKEYRLLPNPTTYRNWNVHFHPSVTRVRVLNLDLDYPGDVKVQALNGSPSVSYGGGKTLGEGRVQVVHKRFLAPLEEDSPADNTISADEAATAELLAEIKQLQQQLANAKALHESDIYTIGEALIEAANGDNYRSGSRWCSEYDEAIEEVNRNLAVKLPLREQEWDVEICFSTYTARVTATTAEEAEAEARRRFEQGDIEPDISDMEAELA